MRNTLSRSAALLLALTAFAAPGRSFAGAPRDARPPATPVAHVTEAQIRNYHVTAADGDILPGHLRVRRGETVRITFVSRDDKYSIRFKDFGIKETLEPEKPVTIEISPGKAGTYEFRCTRVWGVKHFANNGSLVVTE